MAEEKSIYAWLINNWFKVAVLLVIATGFYWYEYRPSRIRKDCYRSAVNGVNFDKNYRSCLLRNGLEK